MKNLLTDVFVPPSKDRRAHVLVGGVLAASSLKGLETEQSAVDLPGKGFLPKLIHLKK